MASKILALFIFVVASRAQQVRRETELPPPEQRARELIRAQLNAGLEPRTVDRLASLSLSYSVVAVPLLLEYIEQQKAESQESKRAVERASDIIAFIGDDIALDAVARLVASDAPRFAHLVGRSLDYAWGRENPFELAYRLEARGEGAVTRELAKWVRDSVGYRGASRAWAAAMAPRHRGLTPARAIATDPLVRLLSMKLPADLKAEILAAFSSGAQ